MATQTVIRGLPIPEPLGGSTLSVLAPGYIGEAVRLEQAGAARGGGDLLPLAEAAASVDAVVVERVSLVLQAPTPPAAGAGGRGAEPAAAPQVIVPAQEGVDYAVLHTDETGHATWLFPTSASSTGKAVFDVPPQTPAAPQPAADSGGRGPVTSVMRRIVRVVAWLAEPVVGAGAKAMAGAWESGKRPYGLWQVGAGGSLEPPRWNELAGGPTLLLIHGTFSTPPVGFGGWLGTPAFDAVAARYGGRVLAFAHPSLSASPAENIDWLQKQLPADNSFKGPVDIVCHSRGGLVARELAARAAAGNAPKVARVCQVGAPNLGTPLANASHWTDFLDAHTNCLTLLPDSTTTIVLEGLLCLVKIVGSGVARGLPGLAAMDPAGDSLKALGMRGVGTARWFTVGANYRPDGGTAAGLAHRLAATASDAAVDAFFASDNDTVVPADGCHRPGPTVEDSLRIDGGVTNHVNYFHSSEVQAALARWLQ